ncbi:MAG: sulfur carrier protein ThiS [Planctomycetes bacterium]|nr:sulfur carrier protein ThiS [Planctomycetota bacterium]
MKLTLNGQAFEADGPLTVQDLLRRIGREGVPCAVEVNQSLVPHRQRAERTLGEGDRIEVVTLVGGG